MGAREQGLWRRFRERRYETFNYVSFSFTRSRFSSVGSMPTFSSDCRGFDPSKRLHFFLARGMRVRPQCLSEVSASCSPSHGRVESMNITHIGCWPPPTPVVHAAALHVVKHRKFGATLTLPLPFHGTFHIVLPALSQCVNYRAYQLALCNFVAT